MRVTLVASPIKGKRFHGALDAKQRIIGSRFFPDDMQDSGHEEQAPRLFLLTAVLM